MDARLELWSFFSRSCQRIDEPLQIGGDFNSVLTINDRLQGNHITEAEVRDFSNCIKDNELSELHMVGGSYTWCNNQSGGARIYSLIDRRFGNAAWCQEYTSTIVEILDKSVSDHCPQFLSLGTEEIKRTSPFRFLNVLVDHKDFQEIVKASWNTQLSGNKLWQLWAKLKSLKAPLKQLNNSQYRNVNEKIQLARSTLAEIQLKLNREKMNDRLIQEEKKWLLEIEKWSGVEERIWQQKVRADWINLGDANTKFFHAYAKARQSTKTIKVLIKADGTRCITHDQIKDEVRVFYVNLMGTAATVLPMIDKEIVAKGPKVTHEQQVQLCSSFTRKEIQDALFSINANKSPGIDGYNAYFFQKVWGIMGEDIVDAVQEFYTT